MDYKEKYEQSLERAKKLQETCDSQAVVGWCEYLFPELHESEDEKIRKALIDGFTVMKESKNCGKTFSNHNIPVVDILAWLEKQGEQKLPIEKLPEEMKTIGESLGFTTQEECDEYNKMVSDIIMSADKVEPKFKVGDWVVNKFGDVWHIDSFDSKNYQVSNRDKYCYFPIEKQNEMHLWTIQDAKAGDVLVASDGSIFIFASVDGSACKHYVALTTDGAININEGLEHYWETSRAVHPATKEERDTLFVAMKEAGYEWDAEKKELKKVEQKSWSEEDEVKINRIVACLENLNVADNDILLKDVDWLKSLRPQNNITDEELAQAKKDAYNDALDKIEYHSGEPTFDDGWSAAIWYLKKKNAMPQTQWKPSDLPHWQKSTLPNDNTTGFNSDYFCHKGYNINYKELFEKLPKDD